MPFKCSAPKCSSNYRPNDKISVFKFPKDKELREKWIRAIKREKSFKVTDSSRICIKHFHESQILREVRYTDPNTGVVHRAPLKFPKLEQSAVPEILPNCPAYLSKCESGRESLEEKRCRIENENPAKVVAESSKEYEAYIQKISFCNIDEFIQCLKEHKKLIDNIDKWDILYRSNEVWFLFMEHVPKIQFSVIIDEKCRVRVFNETTELDFGTLSKHGNFFSKFLVNSTMTNLNEFGEVLEKVHAVFSSNKNSLEVHICVQTIETTFNKLKLLVDDDQRKSVDFLLEQIILLQKKLGQRQQWARNWEILDTILKD